MANFIWVSYIGYLSDCSKLPGNHTINRLTCNPLGRSNRCQIVVRVRDTNAWVLPWYWSSLVRHRQSELGHWGHFHRREMSHKSGSQTPGRINIYKWDVNKRNSTRRTNETRVPKHVPVNKVCKTCRIQYSSHQKKERTQFSWINTNNHAW